MELWEFGQNGSPNDNVIQQQLDQSLSDKYIFVCNAGTVG